jgi:hypothetical protein
MKKMTSIERILTTLKLQEPDRVPTFDGVHKKVRDAITGNPNASYEDFVDFVDTDGIVVGDRVDCWSYEDIGVSKTGRQLKRGQWGAIVQRNGDITGSSNW